MTDHLSKNKRTWNMSRVRSSNTKPEFIVRSLLHRAGFRFSLRRKDLIGNPDIVLPKYKTVIFVHGCFWHRHPGCKRASIPATNREKWQEKFKKNIKRDFLVKDTLEKEGWQVIVIWECEAKKDPNTVLEKIINQIDPVRKNKVIYSDKRTILKIADQRFAYKFNCRTNDEKI
jgi:DNA mismatch endonuclease, patch repair protein